MIILIAQFEFPAAARDRVLEIGRHMDLETAREPACIMYRHAVDVSDPNRVILSETWPDASALKAHFRSSHFRAFRAAVPQLAVRSKVVQFEGTAVAATDSTHWKSLVAASRS